MPYRITRLDTRHEGWASLHVASVETPEGDEIRREIEDHGDAVAVLPYDPERRVAMLVRQFRVPIFQVTGQDSHLEVPAGLLEDDGPAASACREAMEETGLELSAIEQVGTIWSLPGISTERIHVFLAAYSAADRTGPGGGLKNENEHITVEEIRLRDLAEMADDGRLDDMKTLLLLQTLRLRRGDLFSA